MACMSNCYACASAVAVGRGTCSNAFAFAELGMSRSNAGHVCGRVICGAVFHTAYYGRRARAGPSMEVELSLPPPMPTPSTQVQENLPTPGPEPGEGNLGGES